MNAHRWKPIQDLPANWETLQSKELPALASVWKEQAERLKNSRALQQFNARLRREWAIETGIIENLYTIDRGTTQLLIEKGISANLIPHGATDKPVEIVVAFLQDQEEAIEGLFDFVSQRRELSTSYIKQLHQVFTRHQDTIAARNGLGRMVEVRLLKGDWKKWPNNPTRPDGSVYEYCPPEQVASEMDRLLDMHRRHQEMNVSPEVEAAWIHHRFTQIHPFQDGNGRIARSLASLIFLRAGWFPLVIRRERREDYIHALEAADAGDLQPLVALFANIQKRAFLKALSISEDVLRTRKPRLEQVIDAAVKRLQHREKEVQKQYRRVFEVAGRLKERAYAKLYEAATAISSELHRVHRSYYAVAEVSDPSTDYWFKSQIIAIAKQLDYYADTRTFRAWARLKIQEERQVQIVISFHSFGFEFVGIMVASAFLEFRDRTEDNEVTVEGPYALTEDLFQFSYNESPPVVIDRFERWLDEVVLIGLDQWRRQL